MHMLLSHMRQLYRTTLLIGLALLVIRFIIRFHILNLDALVIKLNRMSYKTLPHARNFYLNTRLAHLWTTLIWSCTLFLQLRWQLLLSLRQVLGQSGHLFHYFSFWISWIGSTETFLACKLLRLCSFNLNYFCRSFIVFLCCDLGNILLKLINAVKSLVVTIISEHEPLFENFGKRIKRIYGAGKNIRFSHIVLLLAVWRCNYQNIWHTQI